MTEVDHGDSGGGQLELFTVPAAALAAVDPPLSPDRRRTLRQRDLLTAGRHPLSALIPGLRIHPEAAPVDLGIPGRRCGNCRWRMNVNLGSSRDYPKCGYPGLQTAESYERHGPPRVSRSAASDVRRWWPACTDHEYGDPDLSPDAHRQIPPDQHEGWTL